MAIKKASLQKCTLMRKEDAQHAWWVVNADERILGRLATEIAMVLMGKHRPEYTPHVDTGDFVVVTNAAKVRVTGKKAQTKAYPYYTYHMGGYKVVSYEEMMAKKPEKIVVEAVRRMLPKGKLGRGMLSKLKVYRGAEHPHAAQQPEALSLN